MIKGQKECFKNSNRSVLKTLLYLVTIKFGGEVLVYDIFEVLNKDLIIRHRYKGIHLVVEKLLLTLK